MLTNFDEIFWRMGYMTRNNWLNFGGDPEYDLDPGILSEFLPLQDLRDEL